MAIKRIRLEAFAEPARLDEVKKRFLREAQVAARLRHRNIVTTHDIVSSPATSFIVMELVEGQTLQSLLQARGRVGLGETIRVLGRWLPPSTTRTRAGSSTATSSPRTS